MQWGTLSAGELRLAPSRREPLPDTFPTLLVTPGALENKSPRAAILVSRLPRRIHAEDPWLDAVRQAVRRCRSEGWHLVTSVGLPGWDYIAWFAGKMEAPQVIVLPPTRPALTEETAVAVTTELDLPPDATAFMSPLVVGMVNKAGCATASAAKQSPRLLKEQSSHFRDRLVAALADIWLPVAIRPGGFWSKLIDGAQGVDRVFLIPYPKSKTYFADRQKLLPNRAADDMLRARLTHFTRGAYGPWPGERTADYFQALSNAPAGNPRDGKATLTYILNSGVLRGSGALVRGRTPAISFTRLDPREFLAKGRFRSSLHRPVAEPYGIVLPRDLLSALGARPVMYGDDVTYDRLNPAERDFFQFRGTKSRAGARLDWHAEQEWRLLGDLDIASVKDRLIAIALTASEARGIEASTGVKTIPLYVETSS